MALEEKNMYQPKLYRIGAEIIVPDFLITQRVKILIGFQWKTALESTCLSSVYFSILSLCSTAESLIIMQRLLLVEPIGDSMPLLNFVSELFHHIREVLISLNTYFFKVSFETVQWLWGLSSSFPRVPSAPLCSPLLSHNGCLS